MIPALGGKGRQISKFKASMVDISSSKTVGATQRNPVWGVGRTRKEPVGVREGKEKES